MMALKYQYRMWLLYCLWDLEFVLFQIFFKKNMNIMQTATDFCFQTNLTLEYKHLYKIPFRWRGNMKFENILMKIFASFLFSLKFFRAKNGWKLEKCSRNLGMIQLNISGDIYKNEVSSEMITISHPNLPLSTIKTSAYLMWKKLQQARHIPHWEGTGRATSVDERVTEYLRFLQLCSAIFFGCNYL